jgi:hypothetical protein
MLLLGFLERFVIVARYSIVQIGVHTGVFRQDRHQGEILVASRAEWPEPFDVGNCHTALGYHGVGLANHRLTMI